MKKREFQKKAAMALLKKLAEVCEGLGENPNIAVSSKYSSSYFKLSCGCNMIQVSVKQTGELSYRLTDMLGNTDGWKTYCRYSPGEEAGRIIEKSAADFGRLYKDLLQAGTLHGFENISLSFDSDADGDLKEYEQFICMECLQDFYRA